MVCGYKYRLNTKRPCCSGDINVFLGRPPISGLLNCHFCYIGYALSRIPIYMYSPNKFS